MISANGRSATSMRVGAGDLVDAQGDGRLAVPLGVPGVRQCIEFHAGHVAQVENVSVRARALMMMAPNSSSVSRRPLVVMVYWKFRPSGFGGAPICPAATATFCARSAAMTSSGGEPADLQQLRD